MLKDTNYQEKIAMLQPWLVEIIEVVKKDLRKEHLKIDPAFCKRYFLGKNPNLVTSQEMAQAYAIDIEKGNIGLGEFIASRWLLKNTDIYGYFEEKLKTVNPDFESLDLLPEDSSQTLMQDAAKQFGATRTYLFSVFNSVVFPAVIYEHLKKLAEHETHTVRESVKEEDDAVSCEELKKKHERQQAALIDKYEKKLSGLQKKYIQDIASLKKQISQLQKKLTEQSNA